MRLNNFTGHRSNTHVGAGMLSVFVCSARPSNLESQAELATRSGLYCLARINILTKSDKKFDNCIM